ncbi:VOC family protein [Streptomyces sp. AV19]|uniref:VOC family protein n=1 Tax=Streptomyces sp. AV19 TaxID=2793068 RepID=UPI0018FE89EF|nr:VOC family protein [Streptomyces sp. AV19]MBH1935365.1 VOC family protein [Streptomyces sp. AV19]MDG4531251.1 VOC family protein [Streptomyces sp. AV19]
MTVELNHTIVHSRDKHAAAAFVAGVLGLEVGPEAGPFVTLSLANGVTLDFLSSPHLDIAEQHYAFLVPEAEFDAIVRRIKDAGVTHYSGPRLDEPDAIYHAKGGRGTYFKSPDGHVLEVLTAA